MHVSSKSIALGVLSLSCLGCDPDPKNVGNGLESGGSSESGGADDGAMGWQHELPLGEVVFKAAAMPDGGLVVSTLDYLNFQGSRIIRYAPDGTVSWEQQVGSQLHALATLDDGRIIAAGMAYDGVQSVAALWRLSPEGSIEALHEFPRPGAFEFSNGDVRDLVVSDAGVAYVVHNNGEDLVVPRAQLYWSGLDLVPQWSWEEFTVTPDDVAILPSGELRTIERPTGSYEDDVLLRSFSPTGMLLGTAMLPSGKFADDAPLIEVGRSNEGVWARGIEGTSDLELSYAQADFGFTSGLVASNGAGLGLVVLAEDQHYVALQHGPGEMSREEILPSPCLEQPVLSDVVVVPDGSMYVVGFCLQGVDPQERRGFVLQLPSP